MALVAIATAGATTGLVAVAMTTPGAKAEAPSPRTLTHQYKRPADIPFPASNPYTPEKAALGKALFFEPRLSGAENMTCATCHNPSFGWEVPVRTAVGAQNQRLDRQAPTVQNIAWIHPLFWDGRAATAEEQARGPIEAPVEMNLPLGEAAARLKRIPDYKRWFEAVFPGAGVSEESILKAIATYERTIVAGYSPFDSWVDGNENAISEQAKRGFTLFNGNGKCASCHSGWNFTDNKFHDIGVATKDIGRVSLEPQNAKAKHAFKTPGLRDIALRAPYMHNGEAATLEDVMSHCVRGGVDRPSRSPLMQPVPLTPADIADLIAFLNTLTASKQVVSLPILPN
jgi:cytochrome c peroxidase